MTISFTKFNTLLKKKKLSKKALAEKAGLHPSTISRMASGDGNVRIETLHCLCKVLDCDISAIVGFVFVKDEESI
jgi:DNA-binding Xre family transcriptional regulator